jgi:DNA polymerase-3 subunit delta
MADPSKPTVILLFGDDELALQERLTELIGRLGDPSTSDSNVSRFSASRLDLATFEAQLYSFPFLTPRRMVLLDLGTIPGKPSELPDRFFQLLEGIPPTSVLVAVERIDYAQAEKRTGRGRTQGASDFASTHARLSPIYRWVQRHPERALAREHRSPRGPSFDRWLKNRAQQLGGQITPEAASLLREYSGEDTLLADQELHKLVDFTDGTRPIGREDVVRLTPFHTETSIFALVDALGTRNGRHAVRILWQLLDEEDPRYVFGMIARQFRLLALARQALDDGRPPGETLSASPHRLPGFAAEKIGRQALGFTMGQLHLVYRELFALDLATKTGRADLQVGLEALVASLAR